MPDFSHKSYIDDTKESRALIEQQQARSMGNANLYPAGYKNAAMATAKQYQTHESMQTIEKGSDLTEDEKAKLQDFAQTEAATMIEEASRAASDNIQGKRAPAIKNPDLGEAPPLEESILREYGNNFFELWTYDSSCKSKENINGMVKIAGVLKQLPTFSMSTTWESGPAAALTDIVKGFMCSDVMEMLNAYAGYDRSWNSVDEGSDRVYTNVSQTSFNLEFRVYTNQTIGTKQFSTWDTIKNVLSLFAQPSIASKVSINAMGNNAVNSVALGLDKTMDLLSNARETLSNNVSNAESTIDALGQSVSDVLNEASIMVYSRDDYRRVEGPANDKNFYGAKLWKLRLMPGIFQRPLIVYVSNWTMNISKEINFTTNEPIYVDFSIQCQLDQLPNSHTWCYYLDKNVGTNVFNKDTFTNPQPKPAEPLSGEIPDTSVYSPANQNIAVSDATNTNTQDTNPERYELNPLSLEAYNKEPEPPQEKPWNEMTDQEQMDYMRNKMRPY